MFILILKTKLKIIIVKNILYLIKEFNYLFINLKYSQFWILHFEKYMIIKIKKKFSKN